MANIKDVAKMARVSTNTVSRYLNDKGYISEKTRTTIQQAIDELNCIPNQVARNLFKNKTNLVGLVIPDVKHPFFSTMASYIENELGKRNLKMILCNTVNSSEKKGIHQDASGK
ncbi:LacI family DNA-binding transcriptional regulator [Gracilibacillus salitolerans]|uniref:LacI family DNA-binding transcriptional regulator n=1 Tax=Gracilibacillus salitolerans TaxID=2663022 RepID=UPI001E5ED816|nr:LacI family DNA-binding transcriptional regulator [Gracilibacillus salitolerans]